MTNWRISPLDHRYSIPVILYGEALKDYLKWVEKDEHFPEKTGIFDGYPIDMDGFLVDISNYYFDESGRLIGDTKPGTRCAHCGQLIEREQNADDSNQ